MENSFQTSFIPKKPIIDNGAVSHSKKTTSISMVLSLLLLVVMCLSAGGLYLYKDYLNKNKDNLSASLSKIRDSFDKDTIADLEMYDKRTSVARGVLDGHTVLSPLFDTLNKLTLTSIQYTKFEHVMVNNNFIVRMSGLSRDYKSIALQADVFNTSKGSMFKDVVFSNLTKNKNNNVTFDVEFTVDPALLSYSNNIKITEESPVTTGADVVNTNTEPVVEQTLPTTNVIQ